MNKFFDQILQIFSNKEFYEAVMQTKAERGAKGFTCWSQFVAMLFCQIGQAQSLREICGGLASCFGKLRHLGVVEIFFETIKQNLKIKTFVGTSPNALRWA
jgi:hypothetical protein